MPDEHNFGPPGLTVGLEEELMILDAETLGLVSAIESLLGEAPVGEVKPELMESVLEIATDPCPDIPALAGELLQLRRHVDSAAREHGLRMGSSGTHPFALWEDQRIVRRERYRGLVEALAFVARQELVFGTHVHVGVDDPEKAIHVANGLRDLLPLLVGLAANSPFWRGLETGLLSTRIPVFRCFPRVGVPPFYASWEDYRRRVALMTETGLIDDYTYLWYDVRPHPRLGTVEVRAMDSQSRPEHTIAIAALVQCLVKRLSDSFVEPGQLVETPWELIDENRWLAVRHGLDAELVDPRTAERRSLRAQLGTMLADLADDAQELGCADELAAVNELLDAGNGAMRQLRVYQANHDLHEVVVEVVDQFLPAD
jgi:carboxylate-amine ligase